MPTLNWIGKEAVVRHHRDVPYRLLEPVADLSCGETDSGNLIVEGDNLHALKALLPRYAGKVKCIYIDPPYNTGNEGWVYNDNVNSPEIRRWLGEVVGKEGETLDRHDRWLCMMYPRLVLLKQFLAEDGVLLMSLDDNEAGHAKLLLDEIFGSANFIAQLVWEKGRKNDARFFSVGHEYIFVYAKSKSHLKSKKTIWRQEKEGASQIYEEYLRLKSVHDGDLSKIEAGLRSFYKSLERNHPSKKHSRYNKVDQNGVWRDDNMSWPGGNGPKYEVKHPVTKQPCAIPNGGWRYSTPEKMQAMIDEGKVIFREDHTESPIRKTYLVRDKTLGLEDSEDIGREVMGSYFYRSGIQAANELHEIFGDKSFPNPKDKDIIGSLVNYVTCNDKHAVILDSFAGSGTTAHAVLKLNTLDNGQRNFIAVEINANVAVQVTRQRICRVVSGYKGKNSESIEGLGSGFQYCKLSEHPLFTADGEIRADVTFAQLAEFVWFAETGSGFTGDAKSPLLGIHEGRAIYLLYNGILNDKS
ncbi:MAG: Type III restriction-modification system methylation subunit (EC, partial [uncultured Thiotrichaceae bacterium]